MKTVQKLQLEDSHSYMFKHLRVMTIANTITVNNEDFYHPKMQTFIENMPTINDGLNVIAETIPFLGYDNTVCDPLKANMVEISKHFVKYEGFNIVIESIDYHGHIFKSYTLKENDFNKICY